MADPQTQWNSLLEHVRETALLEATMALLEWDEHTGMPEHASEFRSEQLMLLSGMVHRRRTDPRLGEWLQSLADSDLASDPSSPIGASIRCMRRDFDKHVRLPESLVKRIAKATSLGQQAWVKAKKEDNASSFLPHVREIVALRCEEADCIKQPDMSRYDALLDEYEEGARAEPLTTLFSELRDVLVPMIREASKSPRLRRTSLNEGVFDVAAQRTLAKWVAEQIGFDFQRGRLDETEHPFCTNLGPHDHRILTRYHKDTFSSGLYGVLHEAGHGMYEQGLPVEWYGTPTAQAASLGVHESQSRLWENNVGLSKAFWRWCMPHARRAFPSLAEVPEDAWVADLNRIEPSLIRIEADEVTYNLHIMIRMELEIALIEGTLDVRDLAEAWNSKYESYLGIRPTCDSKGFLQDVHWSAGLIGYFPTYTLGNIYAAMLYEAAQRDLGDVEGKVERGEFRPLLEWLRERVHRFGRRYPPIDLIERATGQSITTKPLVAHLKRKLELTS